MVASQLRTFGRGGQRDGHGGDGEGRGGEGVEAGDEHVVSPEQDAEEADEQRGDDHRAVGEDAAVAEVGQQHRGEAEAGEDGDVDLGMSEEPEEMQPEQRGAVAARGGMDVPLTRSPVGRKKLVPAWRSQKSRSSAASRTEKAMTLSSAAVNHPQTVSGRRSQVMPSQRRRMMVTRVLMELMVEAMAKRAMLASQRSMPRPWPGPALATALKGG